MFYIKFKHFFEQNIHKIKKKKQYIKSSNNICIENLASTDYFEKITIISCTWFTDNKKNIKIKLNMTNSEKIVYKKKKNKNK